VGTEIARSSAGRRASAPARAGAGPGGEARLLAAARRGDSSALSELLERASGPAYRFSRGFCRDPHDAEDLVQEVLAVLMRSLARFRGESSLSTWTYVVARRACVRLRRRRAREAPLDALAAADEPRAGASSDPHRRLERRQLAAALERAVAALPMAQREVLVMRDVEGLSASEVGRVLGLGERAVKSRLHRARLVLRRSLAPFVTGADAIDPKPGCPDTARLLSRHIEGELSARLCQRLESHVARCESCGGACDSLRAVLGECRAYGKRPLPAEVRRAVRAAIRGVLSADGR